MVSIIRIIILFLGSFSILFCSKQNSKESHNRVITDISNREISIPQNVEKIIALNAGAMRLVSYMGGIPNVVGVENTEHKATRPYNLAFPEIKQKKIIGGQSAGDAELILKTNPDVIFWAGSTTPKGSAEDLQKKTQIPVITIKSGELGTENDKIYQSLRIIGKTLKKEKRAEELISYIESNIKTLEEKTKNIENKKKPSVYIGGLSFNGSRGLASTRLNFAPFQLTHAKNVVKNLNYPNNYNKPITIDLEKLIEWNPDYIFIDSNGWILAQKEIKKNMSLYQSLKAFKNNNIYIIPRYINNSTSYDYALIDAWYVAKTLYPERFKDIDIQKKSIEILEKFYDKKIKLEDFDLEFKQIKNWN